MVRITWAAPTAALALVVLAAAPGAAQDRSFLGPLDGADLPPLDTGRVAVGEAAPDFILEARDGAFVRLSGYRGHSNVVLVFYRGHW